MVDLIPEKSYFRIGEVSKLLGVAPYVIRYWESEFKSVKPMRAKSDQRLYRRKDVEELMAIKKLLYSEKYTISGARKRLTEIRGQTVTVGSGKDLVAVIKAGLQELRKILG